MQEKETVALRNAGERGIGDDPRHQFYLDLFQELFEHFGRGVALVIGGDFNDRWGKQYREGKVLKSLESFAEALRLGNAMEVRHGSLLSTRYETWRGKMMSSTPDHIIMSEWVLKRDKAMMIGVLQGEELNDLDHRQLLVELDCEVLLGLDEEGCKEPAPLPKWVQSKLYLSDDKMVLDYANEVNRLGEERGCEAGVEELEQVAVKWSGHDPDAEESPVLQAQMDAVMARSLGVLLEAERTVVGKPKVQSKATQAKRKELWSQEAKPKHRRVRRLKELLALYDKGYYRSIWRKAQGIEQEEKLEGLGTKDVLGTDRQRKAWLYRVKGDLLTLYTWGAGH